AKTGHPLVPLLWALDRPCEGDAGGYVHWGATTQNITQTGQLLQVRRAHEIFLRQLGAGLIHLAGLAERTRGALLGRDAGRRRWDFGVARRAGAGDTGEYGRAARHAADARAGAHDRRSS